MLRWTLPYYLLAVGVSYVNRTPKYVFMVMGSDYRTPYGSRRTIKI